MTEPAFQPSPEAPKRRMALLPVGAAILGAVVVGMSLGGAEEEGASADPATPDASLETSSDDAARIRALLEDQYDALIAMDAARYASHLHPDAVWENALGDRYEGREAVRDFSERVAATMEGARYAGWELSIDFVTPEVAVADVVTTLVGQQVGGRRLVDRPMLNVYVLRKEGEAWAIVHTRIRDQWELQYAEP